MKKENKFRVFAVQLLSVLLLLAACAKAPAAELPSDSSSESEVSEVYEGLSEEGKQAYLLAREAEANDAYQLLVAAVEADAALQAVYGGAYIGDAAQLRDLVICLTEDDEATREAFRAVLDGYEPRFQCVTYTEQELLDAHMQAVERIRAEIQAGTSGFADCQSHVMEQENRIHLITTDPAATEALCEDILPGAFVYEQFTEENEILWP